MVKQAQKKSSRKSNRKMKNVVVHGKQVGNIVTTDASGQASGVRFYVPGYTAGSTINTVASYYNNGRFLPGTKTTWNGIAGMTTPGRVYMNYVYNAEMCYTSQNLTYAQLLAALKNMEDTVSCHVYETKSIALKPFKRRPWFDCNNTNPNTSSDAADRSVQAVFIYAIEGGTASIATGVFAYDEKIELKEFQQTGAFNT